MRKKCAVSWNGKKRIGRIESRSTIPQTLKMYFFRLGETQIRKRYSMTKTEERNHSVIFNAKRQFGFRLGKLSMKRIRMENTIKASRIKSNRLPCGVLVLKMMVYKRSRTLLRLMLFSSFFEKNEFICVYVLLNFFFK